MVELKRRKTKKVIQLKRTKDWKTKKAVSQVREAAKKPTPDSPSVSSVDPDWIVPTGSTLLNCACSDYYHGGYGIGKLVNLIGDSSSGKTLLALNTFAEMCMYKKWDDYRLIYDDVEAALEFNLDYIFGAEVGPRIEMDIVSDTIQDFYANVLKALRDERPFIYVLDSLDALTSKEELDRADDIVSPKKEAGSYKTEKAKLLSEILRVTAREIKTREAVVIIVSQTRDNLGYGFTSKTRSGGRALKFYSTHEMWLSIKEPFRRRKEEIGIHSNVKLSKNKLTGKKRNVDVHIYDDYGVDDITPNIDFLVDQGLWSKDKLTILADSLNIKGTKDTLIKEIEAKGLEREVQKLVGAQWKVKEQALRLNRKRRYE
jgi:RecA/RadA recombinase